MFILFVRLSDGRHQSKFMQDAVDELLFPTIPLDAPVRHAKARTGGFEMEPLLCDLAEVA